MLLFLQCMFTLIPAILGDGNDHIHIKLHLPDLLKKHTHVKTVYRHHFHPKKTITAHSHVLKDSLANKLHPDTSFALLNSMLKSTKPSSFPNFELQSQDSWLPHTATEGMIETWPRGSSKFPPMSMKNIWNAKEPVSQYLLSRGPAALDYHLLENHDYDNIKDDGEDEEYTMTEDSIRELPAALQMHLKNSKVLSQKKPQLWSGFTSSPTLQTSSIPWNQYTEGGSPLKLSNFSDLQRYETYKTMQMPGNFNYDSPMFFHMKSEKRSNKGKPKKRKQINSSSNQFGYSTF